MFSGTAIPLLVAAGVLGWIRRGFARTALLLLPAAAVYLTWYLFVARAAAQPSQGFAGPADNDHYHWITWRARASIDAVRGEVAPILQLGVEGFGEAPIAGKNDLTDDTRPTVNVGPTISVARGRLWLTVGALLGVTEASPAAYVRGILGVSL